MKSIHFGFIKILILSAITFLITTSCDVNEPKKDKPKPEGYQEDIPWPSLADSPWPMSLHDPQSTGRTKYIGPSIGIVEWVLDSLINYESAPVIGKDGTIYTCVPNYSDSLGLLAIYPNRKIKWRFKLGRTAELTIAPILSSDNVIYAAGGNIFLDTIYAVTTEGKLKWKKRLSPAEHHVSQATFVLDRVGNIFFSDVYQNIYCYDKNGNELWIKNLNDLLSPWGQLSFSLDGKTLYSAGKAVSIAAISSETGDLIWTYGTQKTYISPIVDNAGNIYTIIYNSKAKNQEFICLSSDGNKKWSYAFGGNGNDYFNQPCIDKFGNFYFGSDTLFSISNKGKLNWKYPINEGNINTPILCDGNNDIYFGIQSEIFMSKYYSVSSKGMKRWSLDFNVKPLDLGTSPAIGNGRIYCPSPNVGNKLFTIK